MADAQTQSQLEVLSEICLLTEQLEMEFWLRGGWAIDFLLGKITRPHDDFDLITWIQNRDGLEKELSKAGYERLPVKSHFENRQSDFRKNEVDVTVNYVTRSIEGNLILNGLPEWVWQPDSLLPNRYTLCGLSVKVLSPQQLLEEKEVYEQIGRTPRTKDIESKKLLLQLIRNTK